MMEMIRLVGGPLDRLEITTSYLRSLGQTPESGMVQVPSKNGKTAFWYRLAEARNFHYHGPVQTDIAVAGVRAWR